MSESEDVREFYDKFSERVLVRDFYYVNLRHEAIKSLCERFVPPRMSVLEIGCGVGILSRVLRKTASRLVAVDISPKNIEIAAEFAGGDGVHFEVIDVIEQGNKLDAHGPFDVVLLADVIEHIPKEKYKELFTTIERILSKDGRVVLTFPSPEVQAYMKAHQPDDVQVIDESIELTDLLQSTSLRPYYFSYCDIFGKNDYVHVVLTKDRSFSALGDRLSGMRWVRSRVRKYRWRLENLGFLRRLKRRNLTD